MSKEEILQGKMEPAIFFGKNVLVMGKVCADVAMDEYAQSIAKESIEELEFQSGIVDYNKGRGIKYAIAIMKTKFNLNMKDETIIGNCDSNGLFTAKNPYLYQNGSNDWVGETELEYKRRVDGYREFAEAHPPLFCYNENNQLVKGVEGLEVVLQHQYEPQDEDYFEWRNCTKSWYDNIRKADENYKWLEQTPTRQVYIAVQPTEKAEPIGHYDRNGSPLYDGDELIDECRMIDDYTGKESIEYQRLIVRYSNRHKAWSVYCPSAPDREDWGYIPKTAYRKDQHPAPTPLPEAQPLEGVKTAKVTVFTQDLSAYQYFRENAGDRFDGGCYYNGTIDTVVTLMEGFCKSQSVKNAQFATDAGGGNKQLLTDCQEMLMNLIALNHVPDEVCPDMNDMISRIDDALTAPSTHSSSEMVERLNNLIETIKGFETTGDVEVDEDLYNQGLERGIKEINKLITQILTIKR